MLVLNGVDAATLILGAGHLPGAAGAEPGDRGASRHFLSAVARCCMNDRILVTTTEGTYPYVVQWTAVVKPSDTSALANGATRHSLWSLVIRSNT